MKQIIIMSVVFIIAVLYSGGALNFQKQENNTDNLNISKINITTAPKINLTNTSKVLDVPKNITVITTIKTNTTSVTKINNTKKLAINELSLCYNDVCKYQYYKNQSLKSNLTIAQKYKFDSEIKNIAWKYLLYPKEFEVKYKII